MHACPLQYMQMTERFKPAFLQPHVKLHPFLHLQDMDLSSTSGAGSLVVLTGVSPVLLLFHPHSSGFL
jgi:hypothetical protein